MRTQHAWAASVPREAASYRLARRSFAALAPGRFASHSSLYLAFEPLALIVVRTEDIVVQRITGQTTHASRSGSLPRTPHAWFLGGAAADPRRNCFGCHSRPNGRHLAADASVNPWRLLGSCPATRDQAARILRADGRPVVTTDVPGSGQTCQEPR